MTIEEIGGLIAQKMLQGTMIHQQLINYYNFLGLKGYQKCHEYHYYEESCAYIDFMSYFINYYNKFLPKYSFDSLTAPSIIPQNWYGYKRQDVDTNTKRNAVKNGLQKWISWEKEVKHFLQETYTQLINMNEIDLAIHLQKNIESVSEEIKHAELKYLEIKATDFDMTLIVSEQECLKKKYKQKITKKKERTEKGD